MDKLITLDNLTKSYDGNCVLDHITHDFYAGESIAFTGHNGCGKSTLLKILAGLISISSGKVCCHKKIGFSFVPEKFPGMDIRMTDYLYAIAGMESVETAAVDSLIREFFLESMIHTKLNELSKGSLQKVGVIQALIAPKEVILLDEPLSGQDSASQDVFIQKINGLREKGVTVFMSCHEKKLIDELSDHEYTISKGKLYLKDNGEQDSAFKVYVRKSGEKKPWTDMKDHGNRYLLEVKRAALKETVLKLYDEGWELAGVEEHI